MLAATAEMRAGFASLAEGQQQALALSKKTSLDYQNDVNNSILKLV